MSLHGSIESKFSQLRESLKRDAGRQITAQGSNAIIMTYPPDEEEKYIERMRQEYPDGHFINVAGLFVRLIDGFVEEYGMESFKEIVWEYRSTPKSLFHDPKATHKDLFEMIIEEIEEAMENADLPILIRTGALYGTEIENIEFLEDDRVTRAKIPLIILYPAELRETGPGDDKEIFFLGVKPASSYRGAAIL